MLFFIQWLTSNNEPNEICDAANITFAPIKWILKIYTILILYNIVNMPDIIFIKLNQNYYVK
jgi:hypothetical protein